MKQGSDIDNEWQDEAPTPGRRWRRRLLGALLLAGLAAIAVASGWLRDAGELGAALLLVVLLALLWRSWSARRRLRRWRADGILVEPELPIPVSRIPEHSEWRWPSHPLIKVPLALLAIGLWYWALVLHQLQLPSHWTVITALLTLLTLWCWREPLLLAVLLTLGVGLLALLGWMIEQLSVAGMLAALFGALAVVAIGASEIRKRTKRPTR